MKIERLRLGLGCQRLVLSLIPSSVADVQGYLRQIPRLLYLCAFVSLLQLVGLLSFLGCPLLCTYSTVGLRLCWELYLLDDVFALLCSKL